MLSATIAAAVLDPNQNIPGFQEGGANANLRHMLTDFGSGYQGNLRQLTRDYEKAFVDANIRHVRPFDRRTTLALAKSTLPYTEQPPKFLAAGYEHSVFDIGRNVVKIGPGNISSVTGKESMGQFTSPPNLPQFLQPIKSAKIELGEAEERRLIKYIKYNHGYSSKVRLASYMQRKSGLDPYFHVLPKINQEDTYLGRLKKSFSSSGQQYSEDAFTNVLEEFDRSGKAPAGMRAFKKEMIRQQRAAKHIQIRLAKQGIHFTDAHAANLATYQGRSVIIDWGGFSPIKQAAAVAKSAHLAPGRQAVIEGLSHGGVAQVLRKALTSFGSPWMGLDFEPMPYSEDQRRRRSGYGMPYGLTPGQAFDAADVGVGAFGGFQGTGVLGWNTAIFGGLDLAISAGTAAPEEMAGRAIGAVAAQAADIGGYFVGRAAGSAVGAFIGGALGGGVGAVPGAAIGGFVGGFGLPFLIDPMVRKISKPINRLVGAAQHRIHFGGFIDSQPAYSMRQRALIELKGSLLNATQWMGVEAQLMHA
jgi:hypothetical protein